MGSVLRGEPKRISGTVFRKHLARHVSRLIDSLRECQVSECSLESEVIPRPDLDARLREILEESFIVLDETALYLSYERRITPGGEAGSGEPTEVVNEVSSVFPGTVAEVIDVAELSRSRIKVLLGEMDRSLAQGCPWTHAATRERIVGEGERILIACEASLADLGDVSVQTREIGDLPRALMTRRVYALMRRNIEADQEPAPEELATRLRRAINRIQIIREMPVYSILRLADRLEILRLMNRCCRWLKARSQNLEEGLHLWRDLVGFCQLLKNVNLREELLEHDQRTIPAVLETLQDCPADETVPDSVLELLDRLRGRSDSLDSLLFGSSCPKSGEVHQVVAGLRRESIVRF